MNWKMKGSSFLCLSLLLAVVAAGCSNKDSESVKMDANGKPTIFVSNYPLEWMVDALVGDKVTILAPWHGSGDPAYWEPKTDQIAAIQSAQLILLNGATYEQWRSGVTLPESRLVLTASGFRNQWIEVVDAVVHSHGPDGNHSHAGTAFTTWMNLQLARLQFASVKEALVRVLPGESSSITQTWQQVDAQLASLDQQLKLVSIKLASTPLLASHPVYQYLSQGYNLNIFELHWEPGSDPGDDEWKALQQKLQSHPARVMLWENAPLPSIVDKLAASGIKSIVFSPCGDKPENGADFLTVMETNIKNLASLTQ